MLTDVLLTHLVAQGVLAEETALAVFADAQKNQQSLMHYLLREQLLDHAVLAKACAEVFGFSYIDLDHVLDGDIDVSLLSEMLIREKQLLPLSLENQILKLLIADPTQQEAIADIAFRTGWQISCYVVDGDKLKKRIARLLHLQEQETLTHNDAPIVQYVEKLLMDAVSKRASDIHLEAYAKNLRIRFRIDGVLYEIAQLPLGLAPKLIAHLKVLAECDIAEKRLPQDGRFFIQAAENHRIDCRLSTCPTVEGEKVVIRLLNAAHVNLEIEALGFSLLQKELFLKALNCSQGMILVTGPTGSGKTITLYSALQLLNQLSVNISSVEDPVEIQLPGINQVPINHKSGLTFAKVLRAFLRQDPDIIMVGEMRDLETAEIAIKASQTGHLVLSTLHTNSAAETLTRLINMGIAPYNVAASIRLIIAQRLVRCLCVYCKEIDPLFPEYFRAVGCAKCQQGYLGRTAIYEVLPMTEALAKLIVSDAHSLAFLEEAKKNGMQTLYESGLEKAKMGITSFAEIMNK